MEYDAAAEADEFYILMKGKMENIKENIYPVFDRMMTRKEKEEMLGQRGLMVWFTGLSGSGKSTLALALERELSARGILCKVLDGDNIRSGINSNLGFSAEDRRENIRRIAEVARLFVDLGVVTIASFISPERSMREMAAEIIGREDFKEIYVSTSIAECERRDVKGLYARARRGEIKDFTGVSAPYEPPVAPALAIDTTGKTVEEARQKVYRNLDKISFDGMQYRHDIGIKYVKN